MSDLIINPKSVSFKDIRDDLLTYLNNQPDAAQWSLFFESNAGRNIVDILAGLGAFLKMEAITARRENFIQFAQNRSSIIGHAQFLGYSAFRGRNKVLKITINPIVTQVLFKYDYVGTVRDRYLIVEEDTVLNAGTPKTFNVIIGEVKEETKIAPTTVLNAFRYTTSNVSQDCRMFIDNQEVEWSDNVEGMLSGKFALHSNPFGSVDAKYLNQASFPVRYNLGSSVKLKWIDLKDLSYEDADVTLYEELGTLVGMETVSVFQPIEDASSIIVKAPLKAETSKAVRGREDQPKIFRQLHPDILDASGIDISSAIMKIFLLRKDDYAFTPDEKEVLQANFEGKRPHGLFPPYIEDAEASLIKLKVDVTLRKNSLTVPETLVEGILDNYRHKLAGTINLADIEDAIEDDDGVKIARVVVDANPWSANSFYRLGEYVKKISDNGKIYRVLAFRSRSGGTEPTWPTEEHDQVVDNEVVWKAVPKSDPSTYDVWQSGTFYAPNAIVRPATPNGFVYQASDKRFYSGDTEPTWPTSVGEKIKDGRLVWIARPLEGTPDVWVGEKIYQKGDVVVPSATPTVMFQCIAYTGKAGSSEPSFTTVENATFNDNELIWYIQDPYQTEHTTEKNQYFEITKTLTVI